MRMGRFHNFRRGRRGTAWTTALALCALHGASDGASDLAAQNAEGQDAVARKGFVINLGLGGGNVSTSPEFGENTSSSGVATDFKIGYAPNDRLLLYYVNEVVFESRDDGDLGATGYSGLGATYFLSPGEKSFYVDGAIGAAAEYVIADSGVSDPETGTAIAVGGGYEFARHWFLDGDIVLGRFDRFNTRAIRVGVNWFYY